MTDDRTVHGHTMNGHEIVRYDRAGKWYVEPQDDKRLAVTVIHAASLAALGDFTPGLPGGKRFDALVRARRASLAQEVRS